MLVRVKKLVTCNNCCTLLLTVRTGQQVAILVYASGQIKCFIPRWVSTVSPHIFDPYVSFPGTKAHEIPCSLLCEAGVKLFDRMRYDRMALAYWRGIFLIRVDESFLFLFLLYSNKNLAISIIPLCIVLGYCCGLRAVYCAREIDSFYSFISVTISWRQINFRLLAVNRLLETICLLVSGFIHTNCMGKCVIWWIQSHIWYYSSVMKFDLLQNLGKTW